MSSEYEFTDEYKHIEIYAGLQRDNDEMLDTTTTQEHARMMWELLSQKPEFVKEHLTEMIQECEVAVNKNECREDTYLTVCNKSKRIHECLEDVCISPIENAGSLTLRHVAKEDDLCVLYFLQADTTPPTEVNFLDVCKTVCQAYPHHEPDELKRYCADFVYETTFVTFLPA